jgi:Lar family restriction alleviation protein
VQKPVWKNMGRMTMTKAEAVEKIVKECSNYDRCCDCPLYVKGKFTNCAIAVMIGVIPARWEDKQANTVKIKPCPFCGGEAEKFNDTLGNVRIKCKMCGISTDWLYENLAIETWNRRADDE